jgi:hypothetical protein
MLDGLLDLLEQDPAYAHFLLDGQMAVVDDYLEVRPEAEPRLRALAAARRLTMGPWYVLMDEFLATGETMVRDLQLGIAKGAAFGGAMEVGYLPDMFGHVAQMPQLLTQAGLSHAVVWRGVPESIDKSAFWWEAPDGSRVRAEYLVVGYSNGSSIPDDAKALVRRIADHETEIGSFLVDGMLFMNGTDHQVPQPWLGRVVAEANDLQDDFHLEITSLPDYLVGAPTDGLPTHRGELRSGARANVLMGVASTRVDVKQANARATAALERRAEPLAALLLAPERWPQRLLDIAWTQVIRNSAHDSICACSVDEVTDAVLSRYAESQRIGEGIAEEALAELTRSLEPAGPVALNPTARPRSGVVEIVVSGEEVPEGAQALPEEPGAFGIPRGLGPLTLDAGTVRTILGMLPGGAQIDTHTWIQDVRVDEDDSGIDITIAFGAEERFDVPIASIKQDLYTRLGARPDSLVRIRIDQPPVRRVLVRTEEVPAYGWAPVEPRPLVHPVTVAGSEGEPVTLDNGRLRVVVDPGDGTFSVGATPGFGRLVDGGDHGDSYNYSPPAQDRLVDSPDTVELAVEEKGPVRARVRIDRTYTWPAFVDGMSRSRSGEEHVLVSMTLELCAGDGHVGVTTTFVNPSRDHRLRVHLPLPTPAAGSEADSAFAVVQRGLTAEGRPDEFGLPTFASGRFVTAGGLTVAHEGLCEYELVDIDDEGAHTLALTLLRSAGMLSRLGMAYRPLPAGPLTPVDGLQMVGRTVQGRFAVSVDCDDPHRLADDFLLPLELVHAPGGGSRPARASAFVVEGAEVSALRRQAGVLEVRVFNPTGAPTTVRMGERSGWLVDLRGSTLGPFDGSFELRPFGIATVRIPGV